MGEVRLERLQFIANHRADEEARALLELLSAVLSAGVRFVQLRCKGCTDRHRYELASEVARRCRAAGAVCVVNDRVDIALAAGADGVHLGAEDLPVGVARRLLGPAALLGATVRGPAGAEQAYEAGASYLGVGPCYPTTTKTGLPAPIGPEGLARVVGTAPVPVLAVGGVELSRVDDLLCAGAYGVAVASAISSAQDPASAARELLTALGAGAP